MFTTICIFSGSTNKYKRPASIYPQTQTHTPNKTKDPLSFSTTEYMPQTQSGVGCTLDTKVKDIDFASRTINISCDTQA